jgi:hypothetical protein
MNPLHQLLALGMLITGSINTIGLLFLEGFQTKTMFDINVRLIN